jgi:hypothetical protein
VLFWEENEMPNLRYASAGPDRLYDSIDDRYFIAERLAVEKLNEALERAATIVDVSNTVDYAPGNGPAARIRALKETV